MAAVYASVASLYLLSENRRFPCSLKSVIDSMVRLIEYWWAFNGLIAMTICCNPELQRICSEKLIGNDTLTCFPVAS